MSGAHVNVTYWPEPNDHPRGCIGSNNSALHFASSAQFQSVHLQFHHPADDKRTIQYLRELAAAATDLADQLERKVEDRERLVAEAVLLS